MKIASGRVPGYTFCVATRVLTERSFYILPKSIVALIDTAAKSNRSLRFLILDDAVASGRTLETLMRALLRESRTASASTNLPNRQSTRPCLRNTRSAATARGTWWTSVRHVSLQGDGEWVPSRGDPRLTFQFERWIQLEIPAFEHDACPLCTEWNDLQTIVDTGRLPKDHTVVRKLQQRIEAITPTSTETPRFVNAYQPALLPEPISVGTIPASIFCRTCTMGVLQFAVPWISSKLANCRVHKCPRAAVSNAPLDSGPRSDATRSTASAQYLLEECGRILLRSWRRARHAVGQPRMASSI